MLVLVHARAHGADVPTRRLVAFGAWTAPVLIVVTTLVLALTFVVAG